MDLGSLKKITKRRKKRVGRGYGSGKAKTSGRGTKGTKARNKVKLYFEGGQLPLIKRLPMQRGKSKFKPLGKKMLVINIKYLELLKDGSVVDLSSLVKYRIIKEDDKKYGVKILGDGELTKKLTVKLPCSKGAEAKILKAGGKVEKDNKDEGGELKKTKVEKGSEKKDKKVS